MVKAGTILITMPAAQRIEPFQRRSKRHVSDEAKRMRMAPAPQTGPPNVVPLPALGPPSRTRYRLPPSQFSANPTDRVAH